MNFLTELLPHQRSAVEKLSKIKVGALYMEQGTGKTRATLSLVETRMDAGKTDCILWLCPCSVKKNLREDILFHCGEIPKNLVIRGIESLSSSDRLYLQLLRLVEQHRPFLVVDESNLVKNKMAIRTSRIIELSKKCQYKLILNGTPVSKNEADMFAQWYILDWRILGYKSYYSFAANHLEYWTVKLPDGREYTDKNRIKRVLNVGYLTEKIAPYTYQIKKDECLKLPDKKYGRYSFKMTAEQAEEYTRVEQEYLENVEEIKSETIYKLFTACQHVVSGRSVVTPPGRKMRTEPLFKNPEGNPRMQALLDCIGKIEDEKCIIFCKYQTEIDEISSVLAERNLSYVIFTGKVNQKKRNENREKFRRDVQFFLANKACGAYGLNLQFCHNVVYYSNDFDLATRMQSEDRVHRMGQEHEVKIIDLYAEGTIDEFIIDCLMRKENLAAAFKRQIKNVQKGDYMEKIYTGKNVYDAMQERMSYIFSEFENIYISFSGGKDSGLLLNLVLNFMEREGIDRPIGLMHQDFEAEYEETAKYVDRTFEKMPDFVEKYWLCLPMKVRNAMSIAEPWWYPWEPEKRDIWVRDMPEHPYVYTEDNSPFFKRGMLDPDVQNKFGMWYRDRHDGKTISLLGLRADESLSRYSAIVNKRHEYDGRKWITRNAKNLYSASPLYDWTVEDVWTANAKFGFDYNRLYDLYYKAGCPLTEMRVASPFIEWAGSSLNLYRIIDPKTWAKVVGRVNGANFGNIYGRTKAMGYKNITLPEGHTWESYTKFLLSTLPKDIREHYERIFNTSEKFWKTTGGGFSEEVIQEIEGRGYKIKRNGVSNYSKNGKARIIFEQETPDDTDDVKSTTDIPSWKRMCYCILKNDYLCRFMGFGPTKDENRKIQAIKKKYAGIIRGRSEK